MVLSVVIVVATQQRRFIRCHSHSRKTICACTSELERKEQPSVLVVVEREEMDSGQSK